MHELLLGSAATAVVVVIFFSSSSFHFVTLLLRTLFVNKYMRFHRNDVFLKKFVFQFLCLPLHI